VTDNNGLDILIAWSIFAVLLLVLAAFVLHTNRDPLDEVQQASDDAPRRAQPDDDNTP
jgi:hypothetical protein